ncbi:PREDICTED: putative disease resistance protein RGA3 [Erythranthe guttata]|uniref:putative disease resistance protein RGA3 n=1 Tax=Erythranthe guttata TaxID=4155 RepID=UPI00064DD151|nr:PREDICTED: putative disease resistance protein RGA3 [Erythranthe guttata]|eukprot:XP_012832972.1 PREDICTED: putative disease resistance protein RGA3 [Erythranthe guttata]
MVGGLLLGKSLDEWLHIEENWLLDLRDENSVSKILKLSFDHLWSPALKKCFAYCSIYPKGYDLLRERLVELWMAEGFLGGNDDMEIVGNMFFHNLLENSLLLQVVERNESIGDLYHLQTLRACADLEKLPNTMKHLMNLRHLHLPSRIELPPEMGRLISLRTLLYFGVSDKKGCGIGELGSLKNLKGELEIYNLEKVHDKEEAKRADLLEKKKSATMVFNDNVKSIAPSFYGIDKCSRSGNTITIFPALERLELVCMWKLTEWLEAELMPNATDNRRLSQLVVVFPRLEYVKIIMCMQLESAPSHFPCLKELEISQAHSELPLASICGIKLISLTKLRINSIDGLSGYASLLKKLEICYCPNFRELPYPHESHGEQELLLLGLSCLRELSIRKCPGLTELPSEMIESCAESLEKLELLELSNLRMDVGMVTGCLQKMHRLSELRIADIPTTNSSKIGLSSSDCSLRGTLSTSTSYGESSHSSVFDAILKGSAKSLCTLYLYGTKQSRDLPEQLQHLTAPLEIYLHDFEEIEELPDWVIGNNNNNNLS